MPLSYLNQNQLVIAASDLNNLLRQLQPGMVVSGRIIRNLNADNFILRIRGYNILTRGNGLPMSDQSLSLRIVQVQPHLILEINKLPGFGVYRKYNHIEGFV
jgi:hypothetical protein